MPATREVVVTGVGVVCPIGVGREDFWRALLEGRGGVRAITSFDPSALPVRIAAEVVGFDPKLHVVPRKSLKVMSRDAQLGLPAANLARADAKWGAADYAPERVGVVFGADSIRSPLEESLPGYRSASRGSRFDFSLWGSRGMEATPPLILLQNLPNMTQAHISIAHDARGPGNTVHQAEISGLWALAEAAAAIERDAADCTIAGAASSRMKPYDWVRSCLLERLSRRNDDPAAASRPFDAERDGFVRGEGAAALILEERGQAERRGARVLARIAGWGAAHAGRLTGDAGRGRALRQAILTALSRAGLKPQDIGHVNAHGLGTPDDDRLEAAVLSDLFPRTPVTAPKGLFGNLYAASGAVEAAASVSALSEGLVPATLNFRRADDDVSLRIVCGEPLAGARPTALLVNFTSAGQAAAVVLAL